jgi:phosphate starvation-inducible PhoH-like protein
MMASRALGKPGRAGKPAPKVLAYSADADNVQLANLAGALDDNLRQIETELEVTIRRRGHQFNIEGTVERAQQAVAVIEHFLARSSRPISVDDIQLYFVEQRRGGSAPAVVDETGTALPELHTRRRDLHGRTPRQRDYIQASLAHDISFGIGPAGTG